MTDPEDESVEIPDHAEYCQFCDSDGVEAVEEIRIVTMSDYVDTPFGQDPPARQIGICGYHLESVLEAPKDV